jgi:hypothetical protein
VLCIGVVLEIALDVALLDVALDVALIDQATSPTRTIGDLMFGVDQHF